MERGGVMEYIGESSAIYYWRALGLMGKKDCRWLV